MKQKIAKQKRDKKKRLIIKAATDVFAEKGYHGALTDTIAERASISKRSMYYYVGDKETLYDAVFESLLDQAREAFCDSEQPETTLEDRIRKHIRSTARISLMQPLHALMIREFFAGGEGVPQRMVQYLDKYIEKSKTLFKCNVSFDESEAALIGWMVFSFFVIWETVMPLLEKAGFQKDLFSKNESGLNKALTQCAENILFRLVFPEGMKDVLKQAMDISDISA